jgi:uncharacterized membrane protein YccC
MNVSLVRRLTVSASRPPVRLAVLSAAAAATAYGLGSVLRDVSPVVAGITALVAVRPTLHASMQEALRQLLGVVIGAAVAFASLEMVGFSALSLFAALVVCLGVAAWLGLGEQGAVAVAVTVILVVGPSFSTVAIETRLLGVVLGSVLALLVSYFARPGTPHGRALADAVGEADRTAALLTTIAATLARSEGRVPAAQARRWLGEAEEALGSIIDARHAAEDAVAGARWSPLIDRDEALAVLEQVRITEGTAVALVSICSDLVAAAERAVPLPAELAGSLSGVLQTTADAVVRQSRSARERPAETLSELTGPVGLARASRTDAAAHVRHLEDTTPLVLGGSLIRDAEKITELLSGRERP